MKYKYLLWRILRSKKFYFVLCLVIIFLICYHILNDINFYLLESEKCPACYGESLCPSFMHGNITLPFKEYLTRFFNVKNVYFGLYNKRKVVLKKLAHSNELKNLDKYLCYTDGIISPCHLSAAIQEKNLSISHLKGKSFLTSCLSSRLLNLLQSSFQEYSNDSLELRTSAFLYILGVNSEPLILQAFPSSLGWAFPDYLGSCGRLIVVESGGTPLQYYYHKSWQIRLDLAYQVFLLAFELTNRSEEYSLYMTDVAYENFAVNSEGKLRLIDLEDVIIVDKQKLKEEKPAGWNDLYVNDYYKECSNTESCLAFNTNSLCSHLFSDHNIYAVCRNILSPTASYTGMPGGLLHNLPSEIMIESKLNYLLEECDNPSSTYGRFNVTDPLLRTLKELRDMYRTNLAD